MESTAKHTDANLRHDFIFLFDVIDGNPNGDPDAGNMPRTDPETMQGLVTDVCIKRKIRNYVDVAKNGALRNEIYVQYRGVLNEQHQKAYDALEIKSTGSKQDRKDVDKTREWMCHHFYDVRTFGAVMSNSVNCGQVRGPIQLTTSRSIDPVSPTEFTITRVAVTKSGEDKETEMGRKALIPYGLFMGYGFVNPNFAKQTSFDSDDLSLFWQALEQGFEMDRSASHGLMALRGLYVFTHDNVLGNAPAHKLFDSISVARIDKGKVARSFKEYTVSLPQKSDLPSGITLTEVV